MTSKSYLRIQRAWAGAAHRVLFVLRAAEHDLGEPWAVTLDDVSALMGWKAGYARNVMHHGVRLGAFRKTRKPGQGTSFGVRAST
jgi:hypothetical protein